MATLSVPFAQTPIALLGRPDVNATAATVYDLISAYRNRRTGACFPKRQTLAQRLGVSVRTISRAVSQLRSAGFLFIRKLPLSNAYELTTPDQWQAAGTDAERRDKNGKSAGTKMASLPGQKWPGDADSSLYEPDVLYPEGRRAAASEADSPLEAAAAAAPPLRVTPEPEPPATLPAVVPAEETIPALAAAMADELLKVHPQPGLAQRAAPEILRILQQSSDVEAVAERIWNHHGAWVRYWATLEAGRFIPQLWRWFRDGDWERPPVERKGVVSESWAAVREREQREHAEIYYRTLAENGLWFALREYGGEALVEVWREKIKTAS
jgi:hypothetical protein